MTTAPNITVNIFNYGDAPDASRIASQVAEAVAPAPASEPIPRIAAVFPERMDDDDRRLLWANWNETFGDNGDVDEAARHQFTRTVLGLGAHDNVSWSRRGSLTQDQVYYLVRVLRDIRPLI